MLMSVKPSIAVVASDLTQPRFLALFEPLREVFDICIYALNNDSLINLHGTGLKLRLFENIPDMPGYLRGLEEELAQCSAIIGIETSRLGTFQAVRAARKFNKPLAVVVNEHQPFFYECYANIRAIQFDICNKADLFFATSTLAAHALQLDKVPRESIRVVKPVVNQQKFHPSAALRQKFRDYIGIAAHETVVMFHNELESWNRPELLIQAYHLLLRRDLLRFNQVRILFAGAGSQAAELKYSCADLGLGKAAMFLQQNPEPFLQDMYAAADIIVAPRPAKTEFHEELPLYLLEAMAAGVVPVVGAGSLAQEFVGDVGRTFSEDSPESLAMALHSMLGENHGAGQSLSQASEATVLHITKNHSTNINGKILTDSLWNLLESHEQRHLQMQQQMLPHQQENRSSHLSLAQEMQRIRTTMSENHVREALELIEELLLLDLAGGPEKAEIFCIKGEALQILGEMEGSMNAFSESLKINDKNYRCFRGLGILSWQGHSNEEALMFFRKALALKTDDAETMLGIGLVYRRLSLTDEALYWLEKCLARESYPPSALVALTQTCMESQRAEYSIRVLERVMDIVGELSPILMTLGQLYMNNGRTAEGHALLQKALGDSKMPAA
jgi:glycosyltransferase involved in cell wall biosynthesis/Tfp pilus assembly protein PilF